MVDEEVNDVNSQTKLSKAPKKPVPLPRQSLNKITAVLTEIGSANKVNTDSLQRKKSENKNFVRGDWKTASEIMHEKSKLMKHEVQKIEKSVRNIIAKRRSIHPRGSPKVDETDHFRSNSLPDDSIFHGISFHSPLLDAVNHKNVELPTDSDGSSEEGSFYTTSELPPPYPPPDLPDESTYDEVTSVTSSEGQCSYYSPSSDSNSIYEDLSKFRTASKPLKDGKIVENDVDNPENKDRLMRSDSWSFYDSAEGGENRYEVIDDEPEEKAVEETNTFNFRNSTNSTNSYENAILIPDAMPVANDRVSKRNSPSKRQNKTTSSVVFQFDPLYENESSFYQSDLLSEISKSFPSLTESVCSDLSTRSSSLKTISSVDESPSGVRNPFHNPAGLSSLSEESSAEEENLCVDKISTQTKPERHTVCLIEGHYGKVNKNHYTSDVRESAKEELDKYDIQLPPSSAPPPIPPRRFDSITSITNNSENEIDVAVVPPKKEKSPESSEKPKGIIRWSSMKKVARIVADNIENRAPWTPTPSKKIEKKTIQEEEVKPEATETSGKSEDSTFYENSTEVYVPLMLNHNGILFRPGGIPRWGVLSQRKLTIFVNKDSPDVKETIQVNTMLSLRTVTENKISVDGMQAYCFEISLLNRAQPCVFGTPSASERHLWMRKLLESLTPAFPAKLSLDYTKAGWCFVKEGISRDWTLSAILLHHRTLYLSPRNGKLLTADLRKARYLTLQQSDLTCKKVSENGPLILIDLQDKTLYLQMDCVRETTAWETAIKNTALQNGPTLSEQQMTKEGVPTIVDKCINFVHTHGSFSEGIYRRNGSNLTVSKILSLFRCDAWSVQLTRQNYNEFDVSSVLKRFFRDLPEPLFVPELHQDLRDITEGLLSSEEDKLNQYKLVLKKLPDVNYLTSKRLIGHLYFIDKQKDKNLMSVDNLAAIWGPTLMHVQEGTYLDPNWSRVESSVICDLIKYYPALFEIDQTELERELKILQVLETYHSNSNQVTKKPSGDLKIWIHLNSSDKNECVSVSVNPQKSADEVCKELSDKMQEPSYRLCLEEVICNESMFRPLHHTERVLDTVLRWGYWDDTDRKDNLLVLRKNDLLLQVSPLAKPPAILCEEFKFADQKSKSFKSYFFEFSRAKLCYFKDKSFCVKLGEWKVEDIIWYIGHEPKRNPHAGWSVTFVDKNHKGPRSKDRPYFGNTICGTTEEQKLKLIAALLVGQYAQEIVPSPVLIE